MPGPRFEGSRIALISQTEQRWKPHADVYIDVTLHTWSKRHIQSTPSRGVPVALFLTISSNLRDSQSVKTKASRKRLYIMYVSHPTMQPSKMKALRHGTICKDTFIFQNSTNSPFIFFGFQQNLNKFTCVEWIFELLRCDFKNTFVLLPIELYMMSM